MPTKFSGTPLGRSQTRRSVRELRRHQPISVKEETNQEAILFFFGSGLNGVKYPIVPCGCAAACLEHETMWVAEQNRCYHCNGPVQNVDIILSSYLELYKQSMRNIQ
ncbi:Pyrimidine-specific ribonucleoside hydrolase RihA [Frankliniella fusca]|uniref:Pyrimidine-specific ribonucleoside hydrolase RihA n=1 Tax=Frankliniella fusca TaxID=407009 RepID=A0AAE1HV81_9NEOP|nr:Pyrimidine-specific ribonucleoside hydrolase RihA [Frankliniella fusca]KAK3928067.1 Pyrimidine-specific ribonucleoside hydrolase RihA [Frankliniella fusca]KAK3928076.1 Pyrimidine-specific ribonucleoside hydrolase RihA [Frankliniella fusca]